MTDISPPASVSNAEIYTDLAGLQKLTQEGHTDRAAALKSIAHQFEAMMVQMMLKSMREANSVFAAGDMTSSSEGKFYQGMFDNQLALTLSSGHGFGLAKAFLRQMQNRYDSTGAAAAKPAVAPVKSAVAPAPKVADIARSAQLASAVSDANNSVADPALEAIHQLFADAGGSESDAQTCAAAAALDGSPAAFVKTLGPLAQRTAAKLGVDSRVLLSQAALETGWGQKVLPCSDGSSSFNFFNIKAGPDWHGPVVTVPTVEYQNGVAVRDTARFRVYDSPAQSFADYARLIAESPRYQNALKSADNPRAYVDALAKSGYATDPQYAQKVLALLDNGELAAVGGSR